MGFFQLLQVSNNLSVFNNIYVEFVETEADIFFMNFLFNRDAGATKMDIFTG